MSSESDRPDEAAATEDCRNESVGEGEGLTVSRRLFLSYGGVAVTAATLPLSWGCNPGDASNVVLGGDDEELDLDSLYVSFSITVQRPEDLVNLNFGFVGFVRSSQNPAQLVRESSGPGLIVVTFPGQHVYERAFFESAQTPPVDPPTAPAVLSRIANPSRLVFVIPDNVSVLPLTTADLLDLIRQYGLSVDANATPPAGATLPSLPSTPGAVSGTPGMLGKEPHPFVTSVELPFRVQISPSIYGRFAHTTQPKTARNRYELWHTRLGVVTPSGTDERARDLRTTRALYAREVTDPNDVNLFGFPQVPPSGTPPGSALTQQQRRDIVRESTDITMKNGAGQSLPPVPMQVNRLMLSALGGWLDSELNGNPGSPTGLENWTHRASLGRDHFVQIIRAGWLFPFGVRASLVQVTERRFSAANLSGIPYLYQHMYIIFRERHRDYPLDGLDGLPATVINSMRQMPFAAIDIIPKSSPFLDSNATDQQPFLVQVAGAPWSLPMIATDRAGNRVKIAPKVVWLPDNGGNQRYLASWANYAINTLYKDDAVRDTPVNGQRVAFVRERTRDETALETSVVSLNGAYVELQRATALIPRFRVPFYPIMTKAQVASEALRHVAGVQGNSTLSYHQLYLDNEFSDANKRQVYFQLTAPVGVNFSKQSDKAGGFLTPNLAIEGLSRLTGPASDLANASAGNLDPALLFPLAGGDAEAALTPKIFGCIPLSSIIGSSAFEQVAPRFVTESLNDAERFILTLQRLKDTLNKLPNPLPVSSEFSGLRDAIAAQMTTLLAGSDGIQQVLDTIANVRTNPDLVAQLDTLLSKKFTNALGELSNRLSDPATGRMSLQVPGSDVPLREAARHVQMVVGMLGTVVDTLKLFVRGAELIKDGQVTFEWRPPIKEFAGIFVPGAHGALALTTVIRAKDSAGKKAGIDMVCSLEDFTLQLMGSVKFISLGFERLQFRQQAGKKPEIDVVLRGLDFAGPLSFIQTLKDILPLDAFSDPPNVSITPEGLQAGVSLGLPDLAIGMFSLQNMAFGAMLKVPFLGDSLSFHFNFCTRENPFLLTVSMLGGGGFFAIDLSPKGVTALEVQLEFGACLALNLGVASGSVSVMAGIYFGLQKVGSDTTCTLRGFLRIRGEMDVLGLISASIEMRMELEWHDGKVVGRATLEVEVSVCFFSVSVTLEVERKFAGANGDPTFAQLLGPDDGDVSAAVDQFPWLQYCEAFAA